MEKEIIEVYKLIKENIKIIDVEELIDHINKALKNKKTTIHQ